MNIPPIFSSDQTPIFHSSQLSPTVKSQKTPQGASLPPGDWSVKTALNVLRTALPTSTLNYDALKGISVAYLPKAARDIITYLRANPGVFHRIASLSSQYPDELPDWTANLHLQELPVKQTPRKALDLYPAFTKQNPDSIQTVLQGIQKYLSQTPVAPQQPAGIVSKQDKAAQDPVIQVQNFLADLQEGHLQEPLNPRAILQRMENLVQSQQMSPDFIRILTSMLWSSQLHRSKEALPEDTFERHTEESTEPKMAPVDAVLQTEDSLMSAMHEPHDPTEQAFQRIELSAQQIRDLCRHLKSSGGITLEEFQNYQPANKEEEELLRYFRQFNIFHAIADLNGKDETLDPSDIRIALEDHTLVLNDAHITLVFNP